jgi:hypothetical protein
MIDHSTPTAPAVPVMRLLRVRNSECRLAAKVLRATGCHLAHPAGFIVT